MSPRRAFFTFTDAGYHPTPYARSHWGLDQLNGPAVVGLAAHAVQQLCGEGFAPTRLTVDLFRAARELPTTVTTTVVRAGRRIRNVECDVLQDGSAVARATLVAYRRSVPPTGELWSPQREFDYPDTELPGAADYTGPFVGSGSRGWTESIADHQNAERTRFLDRPIDVVAGTANSPFVAAAVIAESTSLTTNLGSGGVGYINGDLTVGLARLPVDDWLGVQEDAHWSADGVAVGTATLFDRRGPFGSGMVTAVANPAAQIDFAAADFPGLRPHLA